MDRNEEERRDVSNSEASVQSADSAQSFDVAVEADGASRTDDNVAAERDIYGVRPIDADRGVTAVDGKGALPPRANQNTESEPHHHADPVDGHNESEGAQIGVPGLPATGPSLPEALAPLGLGGISPLHELPQETTRWGRDDLKHMEAGSQGQLLSTQLGSALPHLVGLGDEEIGRRNGEKLVSDDSVYFSTEVTGVGSSIGHLWLLGDIDYIRASSDEVDYDPFRFDDDAPTAYGPLSSETSLYQFVEDSGILNGVIFDPGEAILPVNDRAISINPDAGTISFNPDGTFTFTPAYGYSGEATATFSFTDPRTGRVETGTITIVVEAVADPASISGSAETPEDVTVATPIEVSLNDPDGSESIERVVITGLPTGATLHWNTALPGSVVHQSDGSFIITGETSEIQALLLSLSVSPPADFDGRITLGVEVTTVESNVSPLLPGYLDRETVHFDYHIDVEAVADDVTAVGADKTTPEDVAVHLDTLAATFGDLIDGSETHTVTIQGVDADARLQNSEGVEYSYEVQSDGTKTYTIDPQQLGNVYFLPPSKENGTFDNMSIVAVATEATNGDQEMASAPITVRVLGNADGVTTSGSSIIVEDVASTIGSEIAWTHIDADGSEFVTSVVISGFPAGSTITYTDVGGNPHTFVATGTDTITLTGAHSAAGEAGIRTALDTLNVTAPADSDVNFELGVSITTTDNDSSTTTQSFNHAVTVQAVADAPAVDVGAATKAAVDEDSGFVTYAVTTGLTDTDGSETYQSVVVQFSTPGSGAAPIVQFGTTSGVIFDTSVSGQVTLTGSAADIDAAMASLQVRPGSHNDADITIRVTATSIESNPTEDNNGATTGMGGGIVGPEIATPTATTIASFVIPVGAVADVPTVTGSGAGNEDENIPVSITVGHADNADGSETIKNVVISNVPSGYTLATTSTSGGVLTDNGSGQYTVTGPTDAAINDLLSKLVLTFVPGGARQHLDTEFNLSVTATTIESSPSETGTGQVSQLEASHTVQVPITVTAVVDGVTTSGSSVIVEDVARTIGSEIAWTHIDADGSEFVTSVVIAGFAVGSTVTYTDVGGLSHTFVATGTDTITLTGAHSAAGEAGIRTALDTLNVTAPEHSDVNFQLGVSITTTDNDSSTTTQSFNHAVTVQAVADAPAVDVGAATKTAVDEDSGFVTYAVTTGLTDTDGSETYQSVVVQFSTPGTGAAPIVQFGTISGVTFDTSVSGQVTLTGSAADIDAAMASLQVRPGSHNDADITIRVTATSIESNPTEDNNGATTGMGGGIVGPEIATPTATTIASFVIPVGAVADVPTVTGSGAGNEDENIPVSITVGHADNADGSETIKSVVISNVPSGYTLATTSTGSGVLTDNGSGQYTVTGPTDAAINDLLSKLVLTFVPGGARQHLDTEFNLSVTATTIESTPSETGAGQVSQLEASHTVQVPITVTAVVDGVTTSGSSVIVEDVARTIGSEIAWTHIDADGSEFVTSVVIAGFAVGSTVTYTDVGGLSHTFVATGTDTITLTGAHSAAGEAGIRTALNTLNVTAPAHSDVNFELGVSITTTDNDSSTTTQSFNHAVIVQAVADAPTVRVDALTLDEDATAVLMIQAGRSADSDNSETLSVRITVPSDASGAIGTLSGTAPAGVTFTAVGGGVYVVSATGADADARAAALNSFLDDGITFTPRAQWSGDLQGTNGIRVDAISTEAATLYGNGTYSPDDELAPNNSVTAGTAGDVDTRIETVTTYINVTVAPINDVPVLANASTIVQENNGSTLATDPDLVIALGTRLGLTIADTDGSQGLSMTLTGLPTDAQEIAFGTSHAGVTTSVNVATGTVTISGANANDVLTVLNSLSVTMKDDDDRNFTVSITGTSTDTNGTTSVSTSFSLSHAVTVQAVADAPAVDVGAATKTAVDEDSGFVTYAVTTGLTDTDGSETYQSVVVQFSTPGTGAAPIVQFGTTSGVVFNTGVSGQVTLTGSAADIDAAMASLQVRPGADNGEDITVTVTATSIESNPTEDNNGATTGMGGGIVGPEIATPTATTVSSFVIPVNPVPETLTFGVPGASSGSEDTRFSLGAFTVSTGHSDPDGSESMFIEIDTTSYPPGTVFSSGGTAVGTIVTAGWLRIPSSALGSLDIQGPTNFSGTMTLSVRGVVVDGSGSGSTTVTTATQNVSVTVTPVADTIPAVSGSVGVEDFGAIPVGTNLANSTTGIRVTDNGSGTGNNSATETISKVVLDFPDDTALTTYSVSAGTAVGSAQVAYNSATRVYTITSTLITGAPDVGVLSQAVRAQAEADIRATLAGFNVTMGPTHSDSNGTVHVTATTLDVNGGLYNTLDNAFNHAIRVQAVADTPSVSVVDPTVSVAEDGANIALTINPGNSADMDGSETLSVRITVPGDSLGPVGTIVGTPPSGVTLTYQGGGVYLVTASGATSLARETLLDSFLNGGGVAFDPRANWSGTLVGTAGIKVDVISTEAATGTELAPGIYGGADGTSATETVTDYIDIRVSPVVDDPTVKGQGFGLEGTNIPVPMSVTLNDRDGSETYVVRITSGVPPGSHIYGAGGVEILPVGGVYNLTPADVAALAIRPPDFYSSALQGPINLVTVTDVTDNSGTTSVTNSLTTIISVEVRGVADAPTSRTIEVDASEDVPIALGQAILQSAGDSPEDADTDPDLHNLLVDRDGSEMLSFVIGGLPHGVVPVSSVPGGVTYIGGGSWSVSADAIPTLVLPPVPNFSGENPYGGITVHAVTQELDGDQATSAPWNVNILVAPVINDGTVDGFATWALGVTATEQQNELPGATVSLASAAAHTYVDNDGSEAVVSYTFDLSNLIANAGIGERVENLLGPGAGLDEIVSSGLIQGTFTYNSTDGTITVAAADIAGVAINSTLLLDSNQDFSIPVHALVRDTAIIGGSPVTVDKTESGLLAVDLIGTADVPSVNASDAAGVAGTSIELTLGGASTDTDVSLGRTPSEDIFYVLRTDNPSTAPLFGLVNSSGQPIGLDVGGGTFVLTPAEIGDVRVLTVGGAGGTIMMTLTTVATENDGDRATNSASFEVEITPVTGPGDGPSPMAPIVVVGVSSGDEDGSITLSVTANPDPNDTTNPNVSVIISGIPAGAQVVGAVLLPPLNPGDPPQWVASAAAVNGNLVRVIPPPDFSGTMELTVEGIARNIYMQSASSGVQDLPVDVHPVADGVAISAAPEAGVEDTPVALGISLAERDIDGSEEIGAFSYVALDAGATLLGGYTQVTSADTDASIDGMSLVGYYRVPTSAISTLQAQAAADWHGTFNVTVASYATDPANPPGTGDSVKIDSATFAVNVEAQADAPIVTAPANVSGNEDSAIAISGLSASLADLNTANGAEVLSVVISGVPFGSRFSEGSNNGDGSWTIPVASLAALTITPPLNYSGTMSLTMTAIALELSNGDDAETSIGFNVIVAPKADSVEIVADNVAVGADATAALDLSVRMVDENGSLPGENPPELIRITLTGVPTGVSIEAGAGGTITNSGANTWTFLGTQEQSNALSAFVGPGATGGVHTINLSAVTIDGADTLATPVTDSFQLTVPQVMTGTAVANTLTGGAGTQLIYGLDGADTLNGGLGDDFIVGGKGADTLNGGAGRDTFAWLGGEIGTGVDTIVGFTTGGAGDALDLSRLLTGFSETSVLSDFVRLTVSGSNTTVSVDTNGGADNFQAIAVLQNVTGLNADTMRTNGNLIV